MSSATSRTGPARCWSTATSPAWSDLTVYRDVEYEAWGLVVELDGRLFHESAQARDLDLDRDLEAAVLGAETLRISYGQVFDRGCITARKVAAVLGRRGWRSRAVKCPDCG